MNTINLTISTETGRLDAVLAVAYPELSRAKCKTMIQNGDIKVNGEAKKAKYQVKPEDHITGAVPEEKPLDLVAQDIPLDIAYEDDDVIVINKPQGMVVHPSAGHPDQTLVNAFLYHTKLSGTSEGEAFRPGIVHRIDKDTSGLLMVAKNDQAKLSLQAQLKDKINKRQYLAIVHGNFNEESGTINAPIGRDYKDRKKQAVIQDGRDAVTHFKVLEQFSGYSLVQCELETGRTHQIRVHMKYINHPVAGDPLYGPRRSLSSHGQLLHAKTLGFYHPVSHEWLEFNVNPPQLFHNILTQLQKDSIDNSTN
ncbi:RluA family pseudouridine synthase [Holzapfeliella sp. JNUCC 80]